MFLKMFEKLLGVNVIEKDPIVEEIDRQTEELKDILNKVCTMEEETESRLKTHFVDPDGIDHYISWEDHDGFNEAMGHKDWTLVFD